jgi:hypothetical protein
MQLFFLSLVTGKTPKLFPGIITRNIMEKEGILLPTESNDPYKKAAFLDPVNPADITRGKVLSAFFKINNGKKFSDKGSYLTLVKPKGDSKIIGIQTNKRWFTELPTKELAGSVNGSIAPGLLCLKPMDTIEFEWEGVVYILENLAGESFLSKKKNQRETPVDKFNKKYEKFFSQKNQRQAA